MKPNAVRTEVEDGGGARARHRFAIAGVVLALAAGLGTPALAGVLSRWFSTLPIEVALVGVGFLVALGFLAVGWVLGRRVDKLSDEARRDPMTNVGNRRLWEECLAHEVQRAAHAKMPLSLLMVDVDNLKKLNDAGGHGIGDTALSLVGEVLNRTCRSRDVAARFGGDEFALLLPRTRASEARIVAERIRTSLAERAASHGAPLAKLLTVSIGICELETLEEPRPDVLFETADRALYVAKQAGRNRVEVAHAGMVPRTSTVIMLDPSRRRTKKRAPHRRSL
jgi:diguanylate cyclase (GGDEF)-like protein